MLKSLKLNTMKWFLPCLFLFAGVAVGDRVRYDNYKLFRVNPQEEQQLDAMRMLQDANGGFSFWTDVTEAGRPVDVMVPPHLLNDFQDLMTLQQLEHEILMDNVQDYIDAERPAARAGALRTFGWKDYHTVEEIYDWLREVAAQFPEYVTLVRGGESYQGREILGVHVSFNGTNKKRGIFLEGGIHAREWIAPATVTYVLNEILTSSDPSVREMAESHDWYIFPVFNPDGYAYTFNGNRFWRKTRKPYGSCYGSDPNRNWGYKWNTGGASNNPCAETYAGTHAFSDIETKSMSEYISTIQQNLIGYIAFHSYSQFLLIPYGHSSAHVENYNDLYTIGRKAAQNLQRRYGTRYTVGNIVEVIYIAAGGSMDWVKGTYHTPLTYTYELRDTGRHGFLLPPDQIIPTGQETLDSLVTLTQEYKKL